MPEDHFGERVAERYDESSPEMFDPAVVDPAVDFLADLAGDGAALELGIGTGRIALPLAQRGVPVHGIDLSEAMVARLRPSQAAMPYPWRSASRPATVDGTFTVAYLVFNTINNLTSQDEQVACFQNVAAHLEPGGCFVIEVGVPQLQRLPPGETVARSTSAGPSRLRRVRRRDAGADLASLLAGGRRVGGRVDVSSCVWPAELDLMARLAGMGCASAGAAGSASRSPARAERLRLGESFFVT